MSEPELTIFFDGACPACRREIIWLQGRIDSSPALAWLDISDPGFDASRYGLELQALQSRIHARDASGAVITGMAVIRRLYAAAGLGWLLAPTGWPVLRGLFDRLYAAFARSRWIFKLFGASSPTGARPGCKPCRS